LFNVKTDPGQASDIAMKHPEIMEGSVWKYIPVDPAVKSISAPGIGGKSTKNGPI